MSEVDFDSSLSGGDPADSAPVQSGLPASEQSSFDDFHALGIDPQEESDFMKYNEHLNKLLTLLTGHPVGSTCASSTLATLVEKLKRGDSVCEIAEADIPKKKPRIAVQAKKDAAEKRNVVHFTGWLRVFKTHFLPNILPQVPLEPGSTLNQVIGERDAEELIGLTFHALTLAGYPLDQNTVERLRLAFTKSIGESILSLFSTVIAATGTAPEVCACCTKANQNAINEWHDKCGEEFKKLKIEMNKMPESKTNKAKWVEKGFKECREKLGLSEGDKLPGWANPPLDKDEVKFKIFVMNGVVTEGDKKTPHECPYCEHCFVDSGKKTLVEKKECQVHNC